MSSMYSRQLFSGIGRFYFELYKIRLSTSLKLSDQRESVYIKGLIPYSVGLFVSVSPAYECTVLVLKGVQSGWFECVTERTSTYVLVCICASPENDGGAHSAKCCEPLHHSQGIVHRSTGDRAQLYTCAELRMCTYIDVSNARYQVECGTGQLVKAYVLRRG